MLSSGIINVPPVIDVRMTAVVVEKENRNQNRVSEIKLNYGTISFCQFIVDSSALWTKNVISNLDIKYIGTLDQCRILENVKQEIKMLNINIMEVWETK